MNRFAHAWLASAAALIAHSAVPSAALACSPPTCRPALLLPSGTAAEPVAIPLGAAIGITELTSDLYMSDVAVTARVTRGGSTSDGVVTTDGSLIQLVDAQEGDVWEIHHDFSCSGSGSASVPVDAVTFVTIGPAVDAPTSLGPVDASTPTRETIQDATAAGSCTVAIDAVRSQVQVTGPLGPWGPMFRMSLEVDGAPWQRATSWASDGTAAPLEVFAACETLPPGALAGLTEGHHSVRIVATIPGVTAPIRSDAVDVALLCGGADANDGGAGSLDGGSDAGIDVGNDASVANDDAGVPSDAGSHANPDAGSPTESGGCNASGGRTDGLGVACVLAALALSVARRRRAR